MTSRPVRPWASDPIYTFLMDRFPGYRTPFGTFDVVTFSTEPEISRSREAIYRWLRSGKMSLDSARRIIALSHRLGEPIELTDMLHLV